MPKIIMLQVLAAAEKCLPQWLEKDGLWTSVLIDYHPPVVERLWLQWNSCRVYLHRIHSCRPEEALFHPHPWPSAMRILSGTYEMGIGYGSGSTPPPVAAKLILVPGTSYEMTERDGWHYVRPLGGPAVSIMVAGNPWIREASGAGKKLQPLSPEKQEKMFEFFRNAYQKKP